MFWSNIHDARRDVLRQWTERLYVEYANIQFHFGMRLRTPVIRIEDLTSRWGQWHPTHRTLTISSRLIEKHSWDVVIEVLKHEMAHQVVNEVFGVSDVHGPHFQRACQSLGVAPWAAAASGELPESIPTWKDKRLSDDEERLLKRIQKLLSLAASVNEHEAALALQRVHQLHAKYNVDRIEGRLAANDVYCVITHKKRRVEAIDSMIFSVLNEHFFVKAIYTNLYHAEDLCEYKAVELLGSYQNVMMAEYVYHFLRHRTESLWKDFKRTSGKSGPQAKRSYAIGVLTGFRDKLTKEPIDAVDCPTHQSAGALLAVSDRQLEAFVGYRHPRLSTRRRGAVRGDTSAFNAGVVDGANVTIHHGVGRGHKKTGLLAGS